MNTVTSLDFNKKISTQHFEQIAVNDCAFVHLTLKLAKVQTSLIS